MAVPSIELPTRFQVMFGGVIPSVDHTNLDPSGRSDLLRTIDKAKEDGLVYFPQRLGEFRETAKLQMDERTLSVIGFLDGQLELRVSLHQIASIGYVREENAGHFIHIINVKIGEVHKNPSIFDLAIMYCRTKEIAEAVCECASSRFQQLYREALVTVPATITRNRLLTGSRTASSLLVDELRRAATPPGALSASTASTVNTSLANDYIQELASCLSTNELREFAELLGRWQMGDLPVRELTLKLVELYGPERKQALTKLGTLMADAEQEEFYSFLSINGVQVDLDSEEGLRRFSHSRVDHR